MTTQKTKTVIVTRGQLVPGDIIRGVQLKPEGDYEHNYLNGVIKRIHHNKGVYAIEYVGSSSVGYILPNKYCMIKVEDIETEYELKENN